MEIFVLPAIISARVKTGNDSQGSVAKKLPQESSHLIVYFASCVRKESFVYFCYNFRLNLFLLVRKTWHTLMIATRFIFICRINLRNRIKLSILTIVDVF